MRCYMLLLFSRVPSRSRINGQRDIYITILLNHEFKWHSKYAVSLRLFVATTLGSKIAIDLVWIGANRSTGVQFPGIFQCVLLPHAISGKENGPRFRKVI